MDRFMALAFSLAKKADPFPNPKVGAVLVKGGRVIGRGYHKKAGMPHAEMEALADAERRGESARGTMLYVTLEPCSHTIKRTPPCTKAIIAAGIGRVAYAMKDPNPLVGGAEELHSHGIEIAGPTDQRIGESLNRRYIKNISQKPFVMVKMAMSADGKTATRTGDSRWISCPESRKRVHRLRSGFDAVMVGIGTVIKDDPKLTARIRGGRDPYRVIVDGRLRIPMDSNVLRNPDGRTILATTGKAPKAKLAKLRNVLVCGNSEVDMRELLLGLGAMGIRKVLIEGGSELNAKALEAGIVDRICLFVAPKIIGGRDAKPVFGGRGVEKVAGATPLRLRSAKKISADLMLVYDVMRDKTQRL